MEDQKSIKETLKKDGVDLKKGKIKIKKKESSSGTKPTSSASPSVKPTKVPQSSEASSQAPKKDLSELY